MKRIALAFASSLISVCALAAGDGEHAAGFDFAKLQEVTKLAVDEMTRTNPAHAEHVTGFKTWKSGDDARVKIYLNHEGMAMEENYLCHIHEEGPECHKM